MTSSWTLVGAVVIAFGVASLTSVRVPAAGPADAVPANPTFTRDVLPIFQKSCQDCHRPGQMAPFSLLDYESARPWVRSIKEKVANRYMPPWHLDRSIGEYRSGSVIERRADRDHRQVGGHRIAQRRREGRAIAARLCPVRDLAVR